MVMERDKNGRFKPGSGGRQKGSKNKLTLALQKAIEQVEKQKKKTLFKHFIERAFKSDAVLVATIKKLVADKTQAEVDLGGEVNVNIKLVDSEVKEE